MGDFGDLKIKVLIDNSPDVQNSLHYEKGLSLYIEFDGQRILCDTGLTGNFADNANKLNIDMNNINFCFISHAHNDHTGGLKQLINENKKCSIYIAENAINTKYFSNRHIQKRDLSVDFDVVAANKTQFVTLQTSKWLLPNIAAVFCNVNKYTKPLGNKYLTKIVDGQEVLDDFTHEMSLAFVKNDELVVVSSCSHNGAPNIIESCMQFTGKRKLHTFIGGLHFLDSENPIQEVNNLINYINENTPKAKYFVGHCTGDKAKLELQKHLINIFATGDNINCN